MQLYSIKDLDLTGKKVFIRCDFNVPIDEFSNITDDRRIRSALATINYCLDHDCAIILASHLGRPKGEVNEKYSLLPVQRRLHQLLKREIKLTKDVVGEDAKKAVAEMKCCDVILLENLRFEAEVLQQNHVAALHLGNRFFRIFSDNVFRQFDFAFKQLVQAALNRQKRILLVHFTFRASQVRCQDDRTVMVQTVIDRRQCGTDTAVVGNVAELVDRHIEITPDKYFFTCQVQIFNAIKLHLRYSFMFADVYHHVDQAVGISPFVIIPCHDLDKVTADHLQQVIGHNGTIG